MRPRTPRYAPRAPWAALAGAVLLASLGLPGCASTESGGGGGRGDGSGDATPSSSPWTPTDAAAAPATGTVVRAGYVDPRSASRRGVLTKLTLLSRSSPEAAGILRGRLVMPEAKILEDDRANDLVEAFRRGGFDRFAVEASPDSAPSGCLGVVWLQEGNRLRSLFLMPGMRQDAARRDLPDVYDGVKKLVLGIHQATPGFTVTTGQGWSDDGTFRPRTGR